MAKFTPCSEFDEATRRCRSGWYALTGVCSTGQGSTPICMQEDPHPLMTDQETGLPLFWPVAARTATPRPDEGKTEGDSNAL